MIASRMTLFLKTIRFRSCYHLSDLVTITEVCPKIHMVEMKMKTMNSKHKRKKKKSTTLRINKENKKELTKRAEKTEVMTSDSFWE